MNNDETKKLIESSRQLKRRVEELERSEATTVKNPFIAVPMAISTALSWPSLRGLWVPGPINYDVGGTTFFTNLASPYNTNHQLEVSGSPTVFLAEGFRPQINFIGSSSEGLFSSDAAQWDILGTEAHVYSTANGMTFGCWCWFSNSPSAIEYLISKREGSSNISYSLARLASGAIRFTVSNDGSTEVVVDSTDTVGSGTWQFICGRFDPSTEIKLWINDQVYTNTTSIPASLYNGVADFWVGARDDTTTPPNLEMTGWQSLFWLCGAYLEDATIENFYNLTKNIYDTLWTP